MKQFFKTAVADFKLIFRDPSLRIFFLLPLILFALLVWFLPGLIEKYELLRPYTYLFLIIGVIENTQLFSFISSMVLLDEKETGVARAYGIAPVTGWYFILSRLFFPFLVTMLLNVVLIAVQPFYEIELFSNLLISLLTALVVPVYVLALNSFAKNRVEGLVYVKVFNMLVLLPIASFFIPGIIKYITAVFPTYWIFQAIYRVTEDQHILYHCITALVFFSSLLYLSGKRFLRKHFV